MTETDTRPMHSEAAEWAKQKSISFADRMDALFDELWKEVEAESVAALKRGERLNGAEAQNDALSVFGQVAAYPIILLMGKIGQLKNVPPTIAAKVALEDVTTRFQRSVSETLAQGGCPYRDTLTVARGWLLDKADLGNAAKAAEEEVNALSERLNERGRPDHPVALTTASNMVARALAARGILQIGGDWLSSETAMPNELAHRVMKSIAEELPPELRGETFVKPELVQ